MRESRPTKRHRNPREGETWRHFKGGRYTIVGRSVQHDTGEINVLYTSSGAPTWDPFSRPMPDFMAEVKNDEGKWQNRFERVLEGDEKLAQLREAEREHSVPHGHS